MPDEAIDIMHDGGETRRVAPFARRAAMTARVPSEYGHVADCQRFDDVLHAAGMLMPAMKDDERFFRRPLGNPGPIEKRRAVGQFDGVFGWNEIGDGAGGAKVDALMSGIPAELRWACRRVLYNTNPKR